MIGYVERKIEFWSLLGPFVISTAILAAVFKLSPQLFFMPALMLLTLPLCWKWRWAGFLISLIIILISQVFFFLEGSFYEAAWSFGIGLLLLFGLALTLLSFSEVKEITLAFQKGTTSLLQENASLKEFLEQSLEEHRIELERCAEELQQKNFDLAKLRIQQKVHEKDFSKMQAVLSSLRKENFNLTTALQEMAKLKRLEDVICPTVLKLNSTDAQNIEPQSVHENLEQLKELQVLKQESYLYHQLKKQFEEKTEVLSKTRQELFELQGRYFILQKEMEEQFFKEDPCLKLLLKQLDLELDEKEAQEKELLALREFLYPSQY